MPGYHGDFTLGDVINIKFCTTNTSGVPVTLGGTPVISAYADDDPVELTAGITLSVDFDGVTGFHNIQVDASGANGYAAATDYTLVITTGTVNGASVVGYDVGSFSIENRSSAPVGAAMTLTSGERAAIANALLDLTNAIETGVTLRGANRLMLAALAGKLSGAAGTTVTFRNAVADSKNRIVATVDANGNRTAITADQT